ncbi:hypothetical protein JCM21900_006594 [Sporobolomyces salmonicolor]
MLRVWGCHTWHTLSKTKSKLDAQAVPLVFVGYDGDTRAYRLLDPELQGIVRSCNARFQEDHFALACSSPPPTNDPIAPNPPAALVNDSPLCVTVNCNNPLDNNQLHPIDFLSDPFTAQAVALMAASKDDMGTHDEAFSLPPRDPRNHREVLTDVDSTGWLDGEKGEFLSLLNDYKVFHSVDRSSVPPTTKILGGSFHYHHKGYGKMRTLKVRLVAQGYNQCPGQRLHIQHADIDKAYLHADLNEELDMRVPDGVDGTN